MSDAMIIAISGILAILLLVSQFRKVQKSGNGLGCSGCGGCSASRSGKKRDSRIA